MRPTHPLSLLTGILAGLLLGGSLRAELSPEAQSAVKKGVIAGQQQDFPLALRYFEEAHRLAPDAPEVYFNLGLTESNIPGRELRAMAWFGAYLAAHPAAPNAAAIRSQLDELEVKQQGATARLLKLAEDAAGKLHEKPNDYSGKWQKLEYISWLYADIGDIGAAQRIANLLKKHPRHQQGVLAAIFHAQLDRSDLSGARNTLASIQFDQADRYVLWTVANAQQKMGDKAGAIKTFRQATQIVGRMSNAEEGPGLQSPWSVRNQAHEEVVFNQCFIGDPEGAEKTLKQLESNKRSDAYRAYCSAWVALGYAKSGAKAKAEHYIAATQGLISSTFTAQALNEIWASNRLIEILPTLAEAQGRMGNHPAAVATLAQARQLVERRKDRNYTHFSLLAIAEAQIGIGDIADGMATINAVRALADAAPDAKTKREIKGAITGALLRLGQEPPRVSPVDWREMLEDDDLDYGKCALASAPFLDLPAYLSAVPTDTAERAFEGIYKAAGGFVRAQNTVLKLLKPSAK